MATHGHDHDPDGTDDACTTTGAFGDHGVPDGTDLIGRTATHMTTAGITDPTVGGFFEILGDAFRAAFVEAADADRVPAVVDAAVDDAVHATRETFGGNATDAAVTAAGSGTDASTDATGADVRTAIVPAFYREVAGYYCAFRQHRTPDFD